MSRYIANAAIRGANMIVGEAEQMVQSAIAELAPIRPVAFTNTAYHLPVILGFTGQEVDNLGAAADSADPGQEPAAPTPRATACGCRTWARRWTPEWRPSSPPKPSRPCASPAGLQPERMPGLQHDRHAASPAPIQRRRRRLRSTAPSTTSSCVPGASSWSTGACPASPPSSGCAKQRGRPCQDRARAAEAQHPGVPLGQRQRPQHHPSAHGRGRRDWGTTPTSSRSAPTPSRAIYALGFATRSALTFGGMKGGQAREILLYNKYRVFAFVLALGRGGRPQVRGSGRRHQLRLPGHRRHRHPADPAHRRHHLRARRSHAVQRNRGRERHWSAPSSWCRSASRCAASRSRSPTCRSPCRTARPSRASACARPTCASSSAASTSQRLRVPAHDSISTRSRTARSKSSARASTMCPRRGHGHGHRGRGGRAQDAEGLRAGARAPDPLLRQRRLGHPAHRPARHRLDPHQQERRRQGLQTSSTSARSSTRASTPSSAPSSTRCR